MKKILSLFVVSQKQSGQAMITVLFTLAIVFFLVTQATILYLGNVDLANAAYEGSILLTKTEGYLENAAIRFLRNPNYTGESLQEGDVSCTMQIVDLAGGKDITCTCQKWTMQKKVGMQVAITDGTYTFSKITERE